MESTSGTEDSAVRRAALEDFFGQTPGRFDFFQAVRLIVRASNDKVAPGLFGPPTRESVRFGVNPSLTFPAAQIHTLDWPKGLDPEGGIEQLTPLMRVNFMGLNGPSGLLPLSYSQLINDRLRAKDRVLLEFLDLFHHRIVSLFYQAWEKYRFYVAYERDQKDRLSQYLMDIIGLGNTGLQGRQDVPDQTFLFYSGLLSMLPRSAQALEQFLSDYFQVAVEVESFAGSWLPLSEDDLCAFNDPPGDSDMLGFGVVVGDAVWDRSSRARIRIGPLPLARYRDFLPGGTAHQPLHALTRFFSNGEVLFEVQLILDRASVPPCELGGEADPPPMLGWLTWMNSSKPREEDPGDTLFLLN